MTDNNEEPNIVEIDIVENGQYKNIFPKPTMRTLKQGVTSLKEGESIKVERPFGPIPEDWVKKRTFGDTTKESAIAKCVYKGEEVSFFLNSRRDIDNWNEAGGEGDTVLITLNPGNHDRSLGYLTFEVVTDGE